MRGNPQYFRRHVDAAHDAGARLMFGLLHARWIHSRSGPEIPTPPNIVLAFSGPKAKALFRRGGPITPAQVDALPVEIAAICHVLRDRATGAAFAEDDFYWLLVNLNSHIASVEMTADRRLIENQKARGRRLTEYLIQYLDSLIWRGVEDAIWICEGCGGLFLRTKANQKACTDTCRFDALKRVNYWQKMRETRRKMKASRSKARRQSDK